MHKKEQGRMREGKWTVISVPEQDLSVETHQRFYFDPVHRFHCILARNSEWPWKIMLMF